MSTYPTYSKRFNNRKEVDDFLTQPNIKCLSIYIDTEQDLKNQTEEYKDAVYPLSTKEEYWKDEIVVVPNVTCAVLYQLHNDNMIIPQCTDDRANGHFVRFGKLK